MKRAFVLSGFLLLSVTACDVFESSKTQIEEQYLSQNNELKSAIEAIREQGLATFSSTAEKGTVAACVAKQLDADPMGALIEVEGALQDSADLSKLAETIGSLSESEISLESIPQLLQQGADTVNYLRTLLSEYNLNELQEKAAQVLQDGRSQSQDIGAHLRSLIEQCQ
ncbi:hypothetical protein J8L98_21880 [Pseudoalteromonas sp. MMG013]|uniref:Lipoprotein n=1 Tax=Pseudoalteromonas aurantia 208 TaxID=1314867 RepID=A0ABR9E7T1_9GAMM|nr:MULTISPECIES: hypothetical protein [Pseudoalteromonas]MBE0367061.1 hypothetical protein [Pseudoalteromonas aurantia 208]MBQ4851818.1 hypothetical protein [Pseudoalteromonas sp. MMG012]MBQ4864344.1 hypothetical protein [Pseudoalteromonas sp. MMG013]